MKKKSGSGEEVQVQVQGEAEVLGLSGKMFWGFIFLGFVRKYLDILDFVRILEGLFGVLEGPGGDTGRFGSTLQGRRLLLPGVPTKRTNNNPN